MPSVYILTCTAKDRAAWSAGLRACLPEARIHEGADAPECDYAVLWNPPPTLFARQRRLRAMFSLGAGVNALLAEPSLPRDVPLVRMEDAGMAAQMVEYALYVALRELRGMPAYAHDQSRQRWAPRPPTPRSAYTIGVLGLGVLGGAIARALADFGFDVAGWSRAPRSVAGVRCGHGEDGLEAVLSRSRLLVLCLPLTPDTERLLDRERIARLPRGASIASLARGELIDDAALLDALDGGRLASAYLDVFREEPLPASHRYWRHPRVEITPHVAALTDVAAACRQVAAKIRRFERGAAVSGVVDRARGY